MADGVEKAGGAAATDVVDLNGIYHFKVDAKGRMSLPSSFRRELPEKLVVTRNPHDECLYVFEPKAFNDWIIQVFKDKFGGYDNSDGGHVRLRRKLKSRAADAVVDSAGRIMLSAEQRSAVGIGKNITIVGNTGYFEVWDADRYDEMDEEVDLGLLFS